MKRGTVEFIRISSRFCASVALDFNFALLPFVYDLCIYEDNMALKCYC